MCSYVVHLCTHKQYTYRHTYTQFEIVYGYVKYSDFYVPDFQIKTETTCLPRKMLIQGYAASKTKEKILM